MVADATRLFALRPIAGAPSGALGLAASVDGVRHGETGVLAQGIVNALGGVVQLDHAVGFALLFERYLNIM